MNTQTPFEAFNWYEDAYSFLRPMNEGWEASEEADQIN